MSARDEAVVAIEAGVAECILWTGAVTQEGYPRWKNAKIHRTLYREFRGLGSCWTWDVVHPVTGYGTIFDGTNQLAHRWSYERHIGAIPDGHEIDHLCRNRGCVNPAHLEPVTTRENGRRGRLARGGQDWLEGRAS